MTAVSVNSVSLSFCGGDRVLDGVDLQISTGQFVTIVGPSGCGKSTLLRLVAGLVRPTAGDVAVGKAADRQAGDQRSAMAFVFQEPHLMPWRTARGNVRLPLELGSRNSQPCAARQGRSVGSLSQLIDDSLRLVGLSEADAAKLPRMLSGGMKMRVSLARALILQPELMLLDEPFAALDDLMREQLNNVLMEIWQQQSWTGLFVTHNVAEAVYLSQRVLVMSSQPGRIVQAIDVPFPYPRDEDLKSSADFGRVCGQVRHALLENAA